VFTVESCTDSRAINELHSGRNHRFCGRRSFLKVSQDGSETFRPRILRKFQVFFAWRNSPWWVRTSSVSRLPDHTQTNHIR